MMKKIFALATLALFLVFSWSCVIHKWKEHSLISLAPEKRAKAQVSAVQVQSGEKIRFKKNPAAKIEGDSVVGLRLGEKFQLENSKIKALSSFKEGGPGACRITTTDGKTYFAEAIGPQNVFSFSYFQGFFPYSIPLSDVDSVWIKEANLVATLLLDVLLPAGILVAFFASLAHSLGGLATS